MFVLASTALLMAQMQPAPPEAPAATQPPVAPAATQVPVAASAPAPSSAEEEADGLICRKKMVPHPQLLNRLRSVKVCKTKDQWAPSKTRR